MPTLFGSLNLGRESLLAAQAALDVTQNNIANVNTPGYTRQRLSLVPGESIAEYDYQSGSGVRIGSIESYRDRLIDHRVNQQLQSQGELGAASTVLQQVEALVASGAGSSLEAALSGFFNSFASLANAPEDATLRQQVLALGGRLAGEFKRFYEQVQAVRSLQDRSISETVEEINTLSAGIARLNVEVVAARETEGNEYTLRDQRQELLDRLAALVDVSYFETETGSVTVMTRQGNLIAVGDQSYPWETATSSSGDQLEIHSGGVDITQMIQSGELGGMIKVRDVYLKGYLESLDDLAAAVVSRVNDQHALGADLNGNPGGDFFVPWTLLVPGSNQGAARAIQVAIKDPSLVAAGSTAGGPGDNTNAKMLAGIQDEVLFPESGTTVHQFFANFVFRLGLDAKSAIEGLETEGHLLAQLQNQRDAVSGVSLDDEAVNLIRYQKAFEASARYIQVIDGLTEDVINIIGV